MFNNFNSLKAKEKINKQTNKKIINSQFSLALSDSFCELASISNIEKILDWCNKRKINVEFSRNARELYSNTQRKIYVNSNTTFEEQMYTLLHECGHHLIHETAIKDFDLYLEKFNHGYYTQTLNEESLARKMSILSEEIEAWNRGFNLARRLQLFVNIHNYEEYKNSCLRSYVRWVSSK